MIRHKNHAKIANKAANSPEIDVNEIVARRGNKKWSTFKLNAKHLSIRRKAGIFLKLKWKQTKDDEKQSEAAVWKGVNNFNEKQKCLL